MKKLTNAELEKEIKGLRADMKERDGLRRGLVEGRDRLRAELDAAQHELVHFKQTLRSLHFALNTVTGQLQKHQKEAQQFAVGINIQEPSEGTWAVAKPSVWSKGPAFVALAE